jgi:peptidoglycan/xylan/chitin deacetylase (PgdA/CDA1 family)
MTNFFKRLNYFREKIKWLPSEIKSRLLLSESKIKNSAGGRILVYHGIVIKDPFRFNTLFLNLKTFERQLQFYKKYFNIISLSDFYERKFCDDKFSICLTFDDGFANNYKYAASLLEKYQIPATFFITGIRDAGYDVLWNDVVSMAYRYGPAKLSFQNEDFIKKRDGTYISVLTGQRLADILRLRSTNDKIEILRIFERFRNKIHPDYWLQMTIQEIRELSDSKWVTIGSHGYFHNDMAGISIGSAEKEIARSKKFLEDITGKEIKALAFPYGSYTKEVVEVAKRVGYSQLLATKFLFSDDGRENTLRERLTVNPYISGINQVYATIKGSYR